MPIAGERLACKNCQKSYVYPQRTTVGTLESARVLCPECRRAGLPKTDDYKDFRSSGIVPGRETFELNRGSDTRAPMVQGVFDIETWGLTRDWGVMLVFSMLIHRGGTPEWYNYDITQSTTWPQERDNDRELAVKALSAIAECDIVYAHNGEGFDIKWLRTLAALYEVPFNERKLVDPCRVAYKKYALQSNSLENMAQFFKLKEQKMPVAKEVWRRAVLRNSPEDWQILRTRCQSDVSVLNELASRISGDVGIIDRQGSWR